MLYSNGIGCTSVARFARLKHGQSLLVIFTTNHLDEFFQAVHFEARDFLLREINSRDSQSAQKSVVRALQFQVDLLLFRIFHLIANL